MKANTKEAEGVVERVTQHQQERMENSEAEKERLEKIMNPDNMVLVVANAQKKARHQEINRYDAFVDIVAHVPVTEAANVIPTRDEFPCLKSFFYGIVTTIITIAGAMLVAHYGGF